MLKISIISSTTGLSTLLYPKKSVTEMFFRYIYLIYRTPETQAGDLHIP